MNTDDYKFVKYIYIYMYYIFIYVYICVYIIYIYMYVCIYIYIMYIYSWIIMYITVKMTKISGLCHICSHNPSASLSTGVKQDNRTPVALAETQLGDKSLFSRHS